ncbi:hypothetical protein RF11_08198 [Thelohanellus kitauei]|uniref:Uncharacterized protein n=1 Tax=Thelohanellus kitauei TaxID=669202 RepID=A0A0C2NIG6_THEKT|nr:hypothetical protein RF11_08198 [Thelohanellus kitauei]
MNGEKYIGKVHKRDFDMSEELIHFESENQTTVQVDLDTDHAVLSADNLHLEEPILPIWEGGKSHDADIVVFICFPLSRTSHRSSKGCDRNKAIKRTQVVAAADFTIFASRFGALGTLSTESSSCLPFISRQSSSMWYGGGVAILKTIDRWKSGDRGASVGFLAKPRSLGMLEVAKAGIALLPTVHGASKVGVSHCSGYCSATRCFKDFNYTLRIVRPIPERRNDLQNILDMKEYVMNFLRIARIDKKFFSSKKPAFN